MINLIRKKAVTTKAAIKVLPLLAICFVTMLPGCDGQPAYQNIVGSGQVKYSGRCDASADGGRVLYWPGTSIKMNFSGTEVYASAVDELGANYYYCIIDDTVISRIKFAPGEKSTKLATGLPDGQHSVELFKLTEAKHGKTTFYGFNITEKGRLLPPPASSQKKIEFYGNSITCGYAIDDTLADLGKPEFENNYYSYAAITARHYNADYSCIAKSGIGLMLSWYPIIMPEMYDRVNPSDSIRKWNFSEYIPQVVVINLLQNDSWLAHKPEFSQFKARFGTKPPDEQFIVSAYKSFVKTIRDKYPDATIICALGSMDATKDGSPWPGYIKKAVTQMHDPKVLTHFFTYKNTDGHPKRNEQRQMAESLIDFIDKHVRW